MGRAAAKAEGISPPPCGGGAPMSQLRAALQWQQVRCALFPGHSELHLDQTVDASPSLRAGEQRATRFADLLFVGKSAYYNCRLNLWA